MTNKLRKLSFKREVYSVKILETRKQIKIDSGTACKKLPSFKTYNLVFLCY